jgi:4-amino-4-deoxy-L-arabinose transferase-like glycosyltransferase
MPDSSERLHGRSFWIFLLVVGLCGLVHLDALPLYHEEPRRAIIAQEMILSGDYVSPTVYQQAYTKKPPLQNWLIALLAWPEGVVSNTDARLPSLLSMLGLGAVAFGLLRGRERVDPVLGALAAMTPLLMFLEFGRKSEPDMLLTFLTFASYALYMASMETERTSGGGGRRRVAFVASAACMGLGILTKGLSPLFFYPGMLVYALVFSGRRWMMVRDIGLHLGLSLVLPLAWLALYVLQGDGERLLSGFSSQVADRVEGGTMDLLRHAAVYPFIVFVSLMPWTGVMLVYWRRIRLVREPLFLSSALIMATSLLVLLLSPNAVDRYYMPAFPFFGVLVGYWLAGRLTFTEAFGRMLRMVFCATAALACLVGAGYLAYMGAWSLLVWPALALAAVAAYYLRAPSGFRSHALWLLGLLYVLNVFVLYSGRVAESPSQRPAAERMHAIVSKDPLPVVVEDFNPIRLLVNYTRVAGSPVHKHPPDPDAAYYLLSPDEAVPQCDHVADFGRPRRTDRIHLMRCPEKRNSL